MGENDKLFGSVQKLYIRRNGETEWTELNPPTRDSITLGEMKSEFREGEEGKFGHFEISFDLKPLTRKRLIQIGQLIGYLKSPRCTYRTINRWCAKRNQR